MILAATRWFPSAARCGTLLTVLAVSLTHAAAADPAAKPEAPAKKWQSLFDGKSLQNWESVEFGGEGEVTVEKGMIVLAQGSDMSGIHWTGEALPQTNYELELEAQRIDGGDFFCGIVFPVKKKLCSFVVGGWGGGVVGLSSLDGLYANENETTGYQGFKSKEWYRVRLLVRDDYIAGWINDEQAFGVDVSKKQVSVHPAVELAKPLGLCSFATVAGYRNVKIRKLTAEEIAAPGKIVP